MSLFKKSPKLSANSKIFYPKNKVKDKVGSGGLTPELITESEEAVVALQEDYGAIVEEQLKHIWKIYEAVEAGQLDREGGIADIMQAAFNFKGEATSFGYPMIGQMGASLYRYTTDNPHADKLIIIKLHLDAIGAIARHRVQDDKNPLAKEIAKNLELAIAKYSSKPDEEP
ncbi:MAG: hypothetical protein FJX22_01185 [Alphaproteobacteria bacterium]|nr:hypothetical protein [Alphaproteobacteria bacterium]